ncbi:uncharacterized protein N7496_003362 [Penicillium cataractarum]|uniref:Uncharacterized protein n=1 Tax=Penicillium cataractarum TaxID=2100454 RepID=A0A9W9VHF6_9EURO|nr:uncharacterized protein N7496_003362 [Penicillium cataractarum]KAJ5380934.1 hypothetical protein N7496_003362 [Penicillium cataractarum]
MHIIPLFLLSFVWAQSSAAWRVTYYGTETVVPLAWGGETTTITPVVTTAPLTVSPISTSSDYHTDYATGKELASGIISVTTEYLILPNVTGLPVSAFFFDPPTESTTASPTVTTQYYLPVTLSNPASCTKTTFTYTDSISIILPDSLTAQATDSSLATYVTTYISTISTNLGGQAVTTSRCDVYLNSKAIPSATIWDDSYLTECVDPRRSTCSAGENQKATGSGGCNGLYPPTGASNAAATTTAGGTAEPTKTGGAPVTRKSLGSLGLWSFVLCVWIGFN